MTRQYGLKGHIAEMSVFTFWFSANMHVKLIWGCRWGYFSSETACTRLNFVFYLCPLCPLMIHPENEFDGRKSFCSLQFNQISENIREGLQLFDPFQREMPLSSPECAGCEWSAGRSTSSASDNGVAAGCTVVVLMRGGAARSWKHQHQRSGALIWLTPNDFWPLRAMTGEHAGTLNASWWCRIKTFTVDCCTHTHTQRVKAEHKRHKISFLLSLSSFVHPPGNSVLLPSRSRSLPNANGMEQVYL